nr:uncharacterized protein LOC113719341 [Coffea arabica]
MDCTCVDSAIDQLSRLLKRPSLTLLMRQEIRTLLLDLRFLKMFFSCLAKCKAAEEDTTLHHLRSSLLTNAEAMMEETGQDLYDAGYFASIGIDVKYWNLVAAKLQEKVEHLKPEIRNTCILLVDCSLELKTSNSGGILEFMDSILMNLEDLVNSRDGIFVPVKVQTEALQEKLRFSRNFLDFTKKWCCRQEQDKLEAFSTVLRDWAKNTACLSILYWIDGVDENMGA